jgi:hypothetical protein
MRLSIYTRTLTICLVLGALTPTVAHAWGFEAHRFIVEQAIERMPVEMRAFFEAHRATVVERSIDPDTWREAGFGALESPHHFFHADWKGYGPTPVTGILRDRGAAVARWGAAQVDRNGTLPWRTEEMHQRLRDAFAAYDRRGAFGRFDILFFSAWLAHYASDAYVPFHAVEDYDARGTSQEGIHARFESMLFERYRGRIVVVRAPQVPIHDPKEVVFLAVLEGARLVPGVLAADRQARGRRRAYDDRYWDAFFDSSGAVLERRLNASVATVAAMIVGAWEEAGRPRLPVGSVGARR